MENCGCNALEEARGMESSTQMAGIALDQSTDCLSMVTGEMAEYWSAIFMDMKRYSR